MIVTLHFHRSIAVLPRAVIRAGAVLHAGCHPGGGSAPITGGVPSAAGPAPCLRGPSSGQGLCALITTLTPTVTSATVRRPHEWPARRRRFAPEGVLALHRPSAVLSPVSSGQGQCALIALNTGPKGPKTTSFYYTRLKQLFFKPLILRIFFKLLLYIINLISILLIIIHYY